MPPKKKVQEEKPDKKSVKSAVSDSINKKPSSFDLKKFKHNKNLSVSTGFKKAKWIELSEAFQEATGIPGLGVGHVNLIMGHSDTGKSTLLLEAAVSAQKSGTLPVLIVTEMKWSWEHLKMMGFEMEEVIDEETGEIRYEGFFIYADMESLQTIEDVAAFIADLLSEQDKGKLPYDLLFLWDSVGTIPCEMSVKSNKHNNEWAAGAYSTQFGNYIDQRIILSRKTSSKFTNTFGIVNKVWVDKPSTYGELPKIKPKGGNTFYSDSTLVIQFGNNTNAGTSKIKARKDGKEVEFGKRTKVQILKNHINGITTSTRIIATPHGFIKDDPKDIDRYKKEHSHEWSNILGAGSFEVVEEGNMDEDLNDLNVDEPNE